VDNCSAAADRDALVDAMRTRDGRLVLTDENTGFGGGMNVGMSVANAEYDPDFILVLNNDTILEPSALHHLKCHAIDHPEAGMVIPLILTADGTVWSAGGDIHPRYLTVRQRGYHVAPEKVEFSGDPVTFATGAAFLLRSTALCDIKGFKEEFFLYWEDVDFSL